MLYLFGGKYYTIVVNEYIFNQKSFGYLLFFFFVKLIINFSRFITNYINNNQKKKFSYASLHLIFYCYFELVWKRIMEEKFVSIMSRT